MTDTIVPASPPATPRPFKVNQWALVAAISALAILAVLGWGLINQTTARPEPGKEAPLFEMQFFNGYEWDTRTVSSLEEMRGQVVVLNFWASWCVECRIEADLLEQSWQAYKDKGVVFLGIAYVDVEPNSIAYLQEFGISYPNAPDLRSLTSRQYRVTGVPETFFIDKEGTVQHIVIGPVSPEQLNAYILELLES